MATIQIKRRTSQGSGPLVGNSGTVKIGEPLVDFNGGKLYIANKTKTASSSNPLATDDYLTIPGEEAVENQIRGNIAALNLGTAATKNVGVSVGQIPILNSAGQLPDSVIPKIALTNTFVVNSEAAMLALSTAQEGDVAIRTDLNKSFILKKTGYNVKENWQELLTPDCKVQSVNGKTGNVVINIDELNGISKATFDAHKNDNKTHLSESDREKLDNLLLTNIYGLSSCVYADDKDEFESLIIPQGLIMLQEVDLSYTPPKQTFYFGLNSDMVLTPNSSIDGGTY